MLVPGVQQPLADPDMDRGDNKDPCLEEEELDLYDYVLVHTSIYLVCTMYILVSTVLTKTLQMMLYYVACL
jgi:hypothetical protein